MAPDCFPGEPSPTRSMRGRAGVLPACCGPPTSDAKARACRAPPPPRRGALRLRPDGPGRDPQPRRARASRSKCRPFRGGRGWPAGCSTRAGWTAPPTFPAGRPKARVTRNWCNRPASAGVWRRHARGNYPPAAGRPGSLGPPRLLAGNTWCSAPSPFNALCPLLAPCSSHVLAGVLHPAGGQCVSWPADGEPNSRLVDGSHPGGGRDSVHQKNTINRVSVPTGKMLVGRGPSIPLPPDLQKRLQPRAGRPRRRNRCSNRPRTRRNRWKRGLFWARSSTNGTAQILSPGDQADLRPGETTVTPRTVG